jgi:universal stress protein E
LNRRIVEVALLFKRLQEGTLFLVHAWQPVAERRVASHASDQEYYAYLDNTRWRAKQDLSTLSESLGDGLAGTQIDLRRGAAEDVIPEFVVAEGIDLVVMGTMGRTGLARHLFRNTAERLLDRLPCSVLAVKLTEGLASLCGHVRRNSR